MCLALPLKIVSIEGNTAVGEMNGLTQKLRVDLMPELKVGDYAIVHAGFAIQRLTEKEAKENLDLLEEISKAAGELSAEAEELHGK